MSLVTRILNYLRRSPTLHLQHVTRGEYIEGHRLLEEAAFSVLVYFVEHHCAEHELHYHKPRTYRFFYSLIPHQWKRTTARRHGLNHLRSVYHEFKVCKAEEHALRTQAIIDLYTWYMDQYPILTQDPYALYPDPPFLFVEPDGTPTNQLLDGNRINKMHPDYKDTIRKIEEHEEARYNILTEKLNELIKLRQHLWV